MAQIYRSLYLFEPSHAQIFLRRNIPIDYPPHRDLVILPCLEVRNDLASMVNRRFMRIFQSRLIYWRRELGRSPGELDLVLRGVPRVDGKRRVRCLCQTGYEVVVECPPSPAAQSPSRALALAATTLALPGARANGPGLLSLDGGDLSLDVLVLDRERGLVAACAETRGEDAEDDEDGAEYVGQDHVGARSWNIRKSVWRFCRERREGGHGVFCEFPGSVRGSVRGGVCVWFCLWRPWQNVCMARLLDVEVLDVGVVR